MQAYSDPRRESKSYALPDVEVFEVWHDKHGLQRNAFASDGADVDDDDCDTCEDGWYWQSCFPGCLPDSEPVGPFVSEAEALADAQDGVGDDNDDNDDEDSE